jgi:glutamate dehydrogenase/leucine dehydrogenase
MVLVTQGPTSQDWSPLTAPKSLLRVTQRQASIRQAGLTLPAALKHKAETKSLAGFPGTKEIAPEDIIDVDCDILLPSALENAITLGNVGRVKAKIIAELANGPTTPGAGSCFGRLRCFSGSGHSC